MVHLDVTFMKNIIKRSYECGAGGRDWSTLPDNVLSDIFSRLTFSNYEAFGSVCTTWKLGKGPLSPQMPFLLIDSEEPGYKILRDVSDGTNYRFHIPQLRGKSCMGSKDGWLIIFDHKANVVSMYDFYAAGDRVAL